MDADHELAAFLRSRRERLDPDALGLPLRRHSRRTPGLRREEVAELAGVSTDYVVRLEQARGLTPSPEVLDALAGALRLSADERAYLFDLARRRRPDETAPDATVASPTARLVHELSPLPAMLLDHRLDVLAWNREIAALMLDFAALPRSERNSIELCLFHPALHEFYVDRELVVRESVADLRANWATHPDDAELSARITDWCARSAEFRHLWDQRDVRVNGRGRKGLRHPVVGVVNVDFEVLMPLGDPRERLVIYRAADTASQAALDRLTRDLRAVG